MEHRVKENKRALSSVVGIHTTSAVAEHAITTNHVIDWSKATKSKPYITIESWHIRNQKCPMNRHWYSTRGVATIA